MSTEIKVGLLFFIGLGLALWFTLFVGDIGKGDSAYWVRFPRVQGIDGGAAVTYNGVRVGTVRQVEPRLDDGVPSVAVGFVVDPEDQPAVLIGPGTRFRISQGLLGGSTLDILNSGGGTPIAQDNIEPIVGEAPVSINEALEQISDLVSENRAALKQAIAAMPAAVTNVAAMAEEIRGTVADNRQEVGRAVTNIADMSDEIKTFVAENRTGVNAAIGNFSLMSAEIQGVVAENRADIRAAVQALPAAVGNARDATDELKLILKENREAIQTMLSNFASFSPKLDKIGEDMSKITGQVAAGEGTLGRLVFEDTLHDKAVTAVDSFEQRLDEVEPFTSGFSDLRFYTGLRGGFDIDDGSGTGTAYVRIEPRPWKFYEAGVGYRVAPEDREAADEDPEKFNVDLHFVIGYRFFAADSIQAYRLSVQGGLIESALGGRVDYQILDNLSTGFMARMRHNDYEPDDRRYEAGDDAILTRFTVDYRLWRRVSITAGINDPFYDADPWVGIQGELLDNDVRNLTTAVGILP
ncbi:MAG: MlaD family protein [Planctomycetota bacterium]|jgi:ABC-type transporter Mla subunit MlaD|nr:MlaD family protein [Planctomycetota bacterium]